MQRRFWNWKDDDLTIDISQWLIGLINSGRFRGFDPVLGNSMNLVLNHETTGAIRVDKFGAFTGKFGVLATKQGVITQEYEPITLVVPSTPTGFYRKGLVVFTHEYVEIEGGQEGLYSLILSDEIPEGTAAPFPALTNEPYQTIIGYITIPQNCTALNDPALIYTQGPIPSFANQADFIEKTNGFFLTNLDARNNKIERLLTCTEPLDAANKFYVDQAIANNILPATEFQRGIAELADTAEAEAMVDDQRIMTPFKWFKAFLKSLATQAEANDDVIDNKAITPKTLGNRTATETRKGIARVATEAEAIAGVDDTTIITPYKLKKALPLVPVVIAVNDWNIEAAASVTVAHGLAANWDKVVSMDLTVRNDAYDTIVHVKTADNSFVVDAVNVTVQADLSGLTSSDFNATGFVRGYITLWLKLDIPPVTGYLNVNAGVDQSVTTNQLGYGTPVLRKVKKVNPIAYPSQLGEIIGSVEMGVNTASGTLQIQYQRQDGLWFGISPQTDVTAVGDTLKSIRGYITDTMPPMTGNYPIRAVVTVGSLTLYSNIISIQLVQPQNTEWTDLVSVSNVSNTVINLSGYVDSFGSPVTSTLWTVAASPAGSVVTFGDATMPSTTFTANMFGTYTLLLTATNGDGTTSTDTVVITLVQNTNLPPVITQVISQAYADLDSTYVDPDGLIPLNGWYSTSGTVVATDPNGDAMIYSMVEVDGYNPITGVYGNPIANSNLEVMFSGPNFVIRRMLAASTGGIPVAADGSRFYYFKAVVSDGNGGVAEKGWRIKLVPTAVPASFNISFSDDTGLLYGTYEGNCLLSTVVGVSTLKVTLSGVSSGRLQVGSTVYFNGTHTISQFIANSIPIRLWVGSNGGNPTGLGVTTATFKAYNSSGALLGEGSVEAIGGLEQAGP